VHGRVATLAGDDDVIVFWGKGVATYGTAQSQ
jgi:hypothetical protein